MWKLSDNLLSLFFPQVILLGGVFLVFVAFLFRKAVVKQEYGLSKKLFGVGLFLLLFTILSINPFKDVDLDMNVLKTAIYNKSANDAFGGSEKKIKEILQKLEFDKLRKTLRISDGNVVSLSGLVEKYYAGKGVKIDNNQISLTDKNTEGVYGSKTKIPVITVDEQGRINGITEKEIDFDKVEDKVLTEKQVDDYVDNNGYLIVEVDGDPANELNTSFLLNGDNLIVADQGGSLSVNLSHYIKDTESINELGDVDTTGGNMPSNGEVLTWNGNTNQWEPNSASAGNTDNQQISLAGDLLTLFNGTGSDSTVNLSAYIKDTESINELGDVDTVTNTPTNNQVLAWNGLNWVPASASSLETITNIDNQIIGHKIADYINEDGVVQNINETVTSLTLNGNNLDYVDENVNTTNIDLTNYSYNIYNHDDTLTGNRTVDLDGNDLYFAGSGNVGIGTTVPSHKLQVNGNVRATRFLGSDGTAGSPVFRFNSDANTGMFRPASDNLAFTTGGDEKLRITNQGRVGIGTETPTQQLHITDNVRIEGFIYDSNNSSGSGGQILTTSANGINWVDVSSLLLGSIDQHLDVDTTTNAPTNNQVLAWNGSNWVPANDNNTTYTAGNGLVLNATQFYIDAPSCSGSDKLQWTGSVFVCATDQDTVYTAGTGLSLSGNQFNLNAGINNLIDVDTSGTTNNQLLAWNGSNWVPMFVSALETVTNIANQISGHKIADYTNEAGNIQDINETVTSMGSLITGHKIGNYTAEDGTIFDINESITNLSLNGDNLEYLKEDGTIDIVDLGSYTQNIYNTDGVLSNNRIVDLNDNRLYFTGNNSKVILGLNSNYNPFATFTVKSASGNAPALAVYNSSGNNLIASFGSYLNDNAALWLADYQGNSKILFRTDGNDSYVNAGNVGIGTTSPTQILHIAGNLRLEGSIYDSNNQAGTSGQVLVSTVSGVDWTDASSLVLGSINNHSDVDTITNPPVSDQVLSWNGSDWVPTTSYAPSAGVTINNTLRWDGSAWVESSSLQNDGTNLIGSGNFTVNGNILAGSVNSDLGSATQGFDNIYSDLTLGSVTFIGSNGLITEDNGNFFWDNTNKRLGIGTNTPRELLDIAGNMRLDGTLLDKDGDAGTGGQVLVSTGTGVDWQNPVSCVIGGAKVQSNGTVTNSYGNISGVTRTNTGRYTINFSNSLNTSDYYAHVSKVESPTQRDDINIDISAYNTTNVQVIIHEGDNGTAANIYRDRAFSVTIFDANCTALSAVANSDRRLKTNITTIGNALEKVLALRGVEYNWNTDKFPNRINFDDKPEIGLIAQEVKRIIPEIVNRGDDGYYTLEYGKLVGVLVEAIKDMWHKILKIEDKVDDIKETAVELKKTIKDLVDLTDQITTKLVDSDKRLDDLEEQVVTLTENSEVSDDDENVNNNGDSSQTKTVVGYAMVKEGEKEVKVDFEKEYKDIPYVIATVNNSFVIYKVSDITTKDFKIIIQSDAEKDIKFTWQAIGKLKK